jgi:Mn2+/Fe2+ NRAMP family transporter
MFTIQAAVTIVTAGLAQNLLGLTSNLAIWSLIITVFCLLILIWGKYLALDRAMKLIISVLALSSVISVAIALNKTEYDYSLIPVWPKGAGEIAFLIAFLGWMPAPLDISTWHSLWTLEKNKLAVDHIKQKKSLADFNIGYVTTVFLGVCFMALGALVMFHSDEEIHAGASAFAEQLINLYTVNLGKGASIFIGIAALTTMFSTTLTTLDASPRAMSRSSELLTGKKNKHYYLFWILLLSAGTIIILRFFNTSMITFVKIATILSFLTAPFYAVANFILVTGKHMPEKDRPSKYLRLLSYLGIIFLIAFSLWYLSSI